MYWCTVYCLLCTGVLWQQLIVSAFLTRFLLLLMKLTCSQLLKTFPAFYGTQILTTPFSSARHLSQSISPVPRHMFIFREYTSFYGEGLLASRPTPKLGNHPLSAVRDCLFKHSQLHSILEAIPLSFVTRFTKGNVAYLTFEFTFQVFT